MDTFVKENKKTKQDGTTLSGCKRILKKNTQQAHIQDILFGLQV